MTKRYKPTLLANPDRAQLRAKAIGAFKKIRKGEGFEDYENRIAKAEGGGWRKVIKDFTAADPMKARNKGSQ